MELQNDKLNTGESLEYFNSKSFDIYREWLDTNMKLGKNSSILNFLHLSNFIKKFSTTLGVARFFYLEKLFYVTIELKLPSVAREVWNKFVAEFGKEAKVVRMEAQLLEIENMQGALTLYKKLVVHNQEDRISLKKFIGFIKPIYSENLKKYVDLWNEYLKVYMDDYDAWFELSDVYLQTSNYSKAIFCLEEVLLHLPNNYEIYTKIGDILCTLNNSESAINAIKYYSQSILIKPNPRSFWGIVFAVNIISRSNKMLDQKTKNLLKIANVNLENFYKDSPFKFNLEQFYDIKSE